MADCYYCSGYGTVVCSACGGTGMIEEDGYEYELTCTSCDGIGIVECYLCGGTGKLSDTSYSVDQESTTESNYGNYTYTTEQTTQICKYCNGLGHCSYCYDGDCKTCLGSGSINCSYCGGTGRCHTCTGDGYYYRGAGVLFRKAECASCKGSGICRYCDGSGGRRCTVCGGKGHCSHCLGNYYCSYCDGLGYTVN